MVGAQVSVAPPVRGAVARAGPGGLRQGRGQPAVVPGVKVPAVAERPEAVPGHQLGRQQVIPDEIVVELRVVVVSVPSSGLVVRGFLGAGPPGRHRDGDGLPGPAAEPAPVPDTEAADAAAGGGGGGGPLRGTHLAPGPVGLLAPPGRLSGAAVRVAVLVLPLAGHGGLQVDHLELLLGQSLLQPLQVGFAHLQLRLDVLHGVQVHPGHLSVRELIPPVFGEFLLLPHPDDLTSCVFTDR